MDLAFYPVIRNKYLIEQYFSKQGFVAQDLVICSGKMTDNIFYVNAKFYVINKINNSMGLQVITRYTFLMQGQIRFRFIVLIKYARIILISGNI